MIKIPNVKKPNSKKSQKSNPKIAPFAYLKIGYWNLFVIWTLSFVF